MLADAVRGASGVVAERPWASPDAVVRPSEESGLRCLPVPGGVVGTAYCCEGRSSAPVLVKSGAADAWSRWSDPPPIVETVSPPPTSATAVATTARRWLFFHRARCRRRAARPSPAGSTTSGAGTSSYGAWSKGRGSCRGGVLAANGAKSWPSWVTGAMSGA